METTTPTHSIVEGRAHEIDVLKVTKPNSTSDSEVIYSINIVGWGLSSNNLRLANKLRVLGKANYNLAAATQILGREHHEARITMSDGTVKQGVFVAVQSQVCLLVKLLNHSYHNRTILSLNVIFSLFYCIISCECESKKQKVEYNDGKSRSILSKSKGR